MEGSSMLSGGECAVIRWVSALYFQMVRGFPDVVMQRGQWIGTLVQGILSFTLHAEPYFMLT